MKTKLLVLGLITSIVLLGLSVHLYPPTVYPQPTRPVINVVTVADYIGGGDCSADRATGDLYPQPDPYCIVAPAGPVQFFVLRVKNVVETVTAIFTPTISPTDGPTQPQETPQATQTPKITPTSTEPTQAPTEPNTPEPTKENGKTCTDQNSQGHTQCSNEHSNPNSGHVENTVKTPKPEKTPKP